MQGKTRHARQDKAQQNKPIYNKTRPFKPRQDYTTIQGKPIQHRTIQATTRQANIRHD